MFFLSLQLQQCRWRLQQEVGAYADDVQIADPNNVLHIPSLSPGVQCPLHLPEDRLQFSAYKGHQARRSQVWFPSGAFAFVRFPCLCRTKTWALVYRTTPKVSQVWVVNPTLAQRHLSLGEGGVDKVAEDCWHRLQQHCNPGCRRSSGEKSMKEMLIMTKYMYCI